MCRRDRAKIRKGKRERERVRMFRREAEKSVKGGRKIGGGQLGEKEGEKTKTKRVGAAREKRI